MTRNARPNYLKITLIAGLIAGTLDIIAACTHYYINTGKNPTNVLKYIASAVFGKTQVAAGGSIMIFWGLLFHFIIATSFAGFFVFIYSLWKALSRQIILAGLLYGIFVWAVMSRLVVPFFMGAQPFDIRKAWIGILILMFMIGLPIALITKKMYPRTSSV